jgi:predicted kinase
MQARRYFRLALRYAICGSHPTVLIIMGRIASGKSTLAHALGRELGYEVISSDRVRKEFAGVPLYEKDEKSARRLYSEAMTKETYQTLFQCAASQLDRDASVILDATFGRRQHRDALRRLLDSKGATYRFIEAQAADEVLKRRLEQREDARHEISDARLENFETLTRSYEPPLEVGTDHCFQVATDRPATVTIEETLKKLVLAGFKSN